MNLEEATIKALEGKLSDNENIKCKECGSKDLEFHDSDFDVRRVHLTDTHNTYVYTLYINYTCSNCKHNGKVYFKDVRGKDLHTILCPECDSDNVSFDDYIVDIQNRTLTYENAECEDCDEEFDIIYNLEIKDIK